MSTVHLSGWSFGTDESAESTMRNMAKRVRDCLAHSREVIETANDAVANVTPRDRLAQITTLNDWLSHRFRFIADPVGVELLRDPEGAVRRINARGFTQGDCDEAAMLAASLGMANGIPARFRALSFGPAAPYSHVIADLLGPGGEWYPLDVTKPYGMSMPRVFRSLTVSV